MNNSYLGEEIKIGDSWDLDSTVCLHLVSLLLFFCSSTAAPVPSCIQPLPTTRQWGNYSQSGERRCWRVTRTPSELWATPPSTCPSSQSVSRALQITMLPHHKFTLIVWQWKYNCSLVLFVFLVDGSNIILFKNTNVTAAYSTYNKFNERSVKLIKPTTIHKIIWTLTISFCWCVEFMVRD